MKHHGVSIIEKGVVVRNSSKSMKINEGSIEGTVKSNVVFDYGVTKTYIE